VNERRTVEVGGDWALCAPPNRGEIDAHGLHLAEIIYSPILRVARNT